MNIHETEHYIFHYLPGTGAEANISSIADEQEASYRHIRQMLGLSMTEKIHYYLYSTPEELGRECARRFGEYTPYNGCTASKNEILAVYNDAIKCIGSHEDTHLFTFTLGFPTSSFLEEGVACAMDALWWGIDNNAWVSHHRRKGVCPSVTELITASRDDFYALDDRITYPLSGSFVSYLLSRFGREAFFSFYMAENYDQAAVTILNCSLHVLEQDFFQHIDALQYDEAVYSRITELLTE